MERESLGPYRIDRELGAGGMGTVYAATVIREAAGLAPGATVALKVVHPHLLATEGFFKRFLREAQIGRSVQHDNVVRTLDCDALEDHHFLVMEYVEGQTLADLQRELDKVPEELCRHVAREICKGLAAIHEAGVVHRDLKPENVLITPEHVVKVMDLGVAQLAEESIRLSQTGAFIGSVEYAAPEQFGGEVDHRCDLHALGLLLYELACGQHPYRADDFRVVMHHVMDDEPRRLGEINPQMSAFFEEVVHTLLAKKADDRFPGAAALLSVLDEGEESDWWKARAKALQVESKRPLRRIRIPRETAVYGRDKELDRLRGLFEKAKAGGGQVVLIEGEAGIGKSRLVDEFVARLQADGEDLNFLFGSYPPGGAALAAGGFSSAYRDHFGEGGSEPYLTQTPSLVPAYDAVLRGEPAPSGVVELTKDSLGTCFVHATRNLAAERPTIVLIDDLHFAPEEARALFTALALAAPGHRVLLVGTMRPGVPEDWVANVTRLEQTTRLELIRLGPKDLMDLLRDSFSSEELAVQLGVQIATKSDGNPFFAFEIIRGLREGQFITQKDDGTWASTQVIDEIEIPSSVLDLVNARVADLTEEERDLLDVACCGGYEFDPLVVGDALGMARIPLLKRLGQIERRHRLIRSAGVRYTFDHHQVQEALYRSLSELLRREYHVALAHTMERRAGAAERDVQSVDGKLCVELCEHFLAGDQDERAARYLEAARDHLTEGCLHAQAVALVERALDVTRLLTGVRRANALLQMAETLGLLGRREEQEQRAREAERLAEELDDDDLRGRAATALGQVFFYTARFKEAEAALCRAAELATVVGDGEAQASAEGNLGNVFQKLGRRREARRHHERHLAISREIGNRVGEARATGNLSSVAWSEGRTDQARQFAERSIALFREIGDKRGEAVAEVQLGLISMAEGRADAAQHHAETGLRSHQQLGDRQGEAIAVGNLGSALQMQGRYHEGTALHDRQLTLARETGDRATEAIALVNLGLSWLELGDMKRARDELDACVALCREIGTPYPEGYALLGLAQWAHDQGDPAEAERRAEEALRVRRSIGHNDGVAAALIVLGDVRRHRGALDSARLALDEAIAIVREGKNAAHIALALAGRACLPDGDADAAVAVVAAVGGQADTLRLRHALYNATRNPSHLEEAKRLLDDLLAKNPPEYHESMCANVRVNREILAAWRAEFGEDEKGDPGDDTPHATESETRVRPDAPPQT